MVIIALSAMENKTIPDVAVCRLAAEGDSLMILRDEDHLLRRFGQAEYLTLAAGDEEGFRLKEDADEYLAVVSGEGSVELVDARPASPSFLHRMVVQEVPPFAVLIPWGVASRLRISRPAQAIRLSTHSNKSGEGEHRWTLEDLRRRARSQ